MSILISHCHRVWRESKPVHEGTSSMKLDLLYVDPRLVALYSIENQRDADTEFYCQTPRKESPDDRECACEVV
jgi:hypothetical protein